MSLSSSSAEGETPQDVEKQSDSIEAASEGHSTSDREEDSRPDGTTEPREKWSIAPEPEILDTEADGVSGTIARALSRISTNVSWNPGPPPDGGRAAWMCGKNSCFIALRIALS